MDLMCYASEVHLLAVCGYYYLSAFPFPMIAWPGFPSVVSEGEKKKKNRDQFHMEKIMSRMQN